MELSGRKALNRQKIISSYNLYIDSRRKKTLLTMSKYITTVNERKKIARIQQIVLLVNAWGVEEKSGGEIQSVKSYLNLSYVTSPTKRLFHERSLSNHNFIFRPL